MLRGRIFIKMFVSIGLGILSDLSTDDRFVGNKNRYLHYITFDFPTF